jgi:hypothetical protein
MDSSALTCTCTARSGALCQQAPDPQVDAPDAPLRQKQEWCCGAPRLRPCQQRWQQARATTAPGQQGWATTAPGRSRDGPPLQQGTDLDGDDAEPIVVDVAVRQVAPGEVRDGGHDHLAHHVDVLWGCSTQATVSADIFKGYVGACIMQAGPNLLSGSKGVLA